MSAAAALGRAPSAEPCRVTRTAAVLPADEESTARAGATRISNSFARSRRPSRTINSSSRQTTMYRADTSKGDLQQMGDARRYRRSAALVRHRIEFFCTSRVRIVSL